jgi:hypothetical protein
VSRSISATATALREIAQKPTPEDVVVMKQATSLRKGRGLYRSLYSTEEIDLISRARRIAYEYGQLTLGRFLTLRRRGNAKRSVRIGRQPTHSCPTCGKRHKPPKRLPPLTPKMAEEEERMIRGALKRAQKAAKGKRWIR